MLKDHRSIRMDGEPLDLSCDEDGDGGDPNDIRWSKEVMTLRKINEKSFFMHMTKNGKFSSPQWRVNYCRNALRKVR
jgi:hypothetical protein